MDYNIDTNVVFGGLELIDWNEYANAFDDPWWNRTICRVNNAEVRIGVFNGEFHWHKHETEDEYFHVLQGKLLIDVEDNETIVLLPGQAVMIPKNTMHRPRAEEKTVVLLVEQGGSIHTGS